MAGTNEGDIVFGVRLDTKGADQGLDSIRQRAEATKGPMRDVVGLSSTLAGNLGSAGSAAGKLGTEMLGAFASGGPIALGVAAVAASIALWAKYFSDASVAAAAAERDMAKAADAVKSRTGDAINELRDRIADLDDQLVGGDPKRRRAIREFSTLSEQAASDLIPTYEALRIAQEKLAKSETALSQIAAAGGTASQELQNRYRTESIEVTNLITRIAQLTETQRLSAEAAAKQSAVWDAADAERNKPKGGTGGGGVVGSRRSRDFSERVDPMDVARVVAEAQEIQRRQEEELSRWTDRLVAGRIARWELEEREAREHAAALIELEEVIRRAADDALIDFGAGLQGTAADGLAEFGELLYVTTDDMNRFKGEMLAMGDAGAMALGTIAASATVAYEALAESLALIAQSIADIDDTSAQADRNAQTALENRILRQRLAERARAESAKQGKKISADELSAEDKLREAKLASNEATLLAAADAAAEDARLKKQLLANIAAQAAVEAVMETARGFAALANPATAAYAPAHFTAAGIFGTVGGVAAIAASGISIPASGEEKLAARELEEDRRDLLEGRREERRAAAERRLVQDESTEITRNINITIVGNALLTQADVGQAISEALNAYEDMR